MLSKPMPYSLSIMRSSKSYHGSRFDITLVIFQHLNFVIVDKYRGETVNAIGLFVGQKCFPKRTYFPRPFMFASSFTFPSLSVTYKSFLVHLMLSYRLHSIALFLKKKYIYCLNLILAIYCV